MNPLTIILLTYGLGERAEYAYRTLHSTLDKITYSGPLYVHIADDGSAPEHRSICRQIAHGYAHVAGVSTSDAERRGYGASYNLATQLVHPRGGFLLPLEDDWELTAPLDLDALVPALGEQIRSIRLGYLGFTQCLHGDLVQAAGQTFLLFDPESPEPHVNAGHPRLETVSYQQQVGPWREGLSAGSTEFDWCKRPEARVGVAWPLDLIPPRGGLFAHIGTVGVGGIAPEGASHE